MARAFRGSMKSMRLLAVLGLVAAVVPHVAFAQPLIRCAVQSTDANVILTVRSEDSPSAIARAASQCEQLTEAGNWAGISWHYDDWGDTYLTACRIMLTPTQEIDVWAVYGDAFGGMGAFVVCGNAEKIGNLVLWK